MRQYIYPTMGVLTAPDDNPLFIIRKDVSGGVNTRVQAQQIGENQCETLTNVDIGTGGKRLKRSGSKQLASTVGSDAIVALHDYQIQGGTDQLLAYEDTTLWKSSGEGNWTTLKTDFTSSTDVGMISCKMSGITPDDITIIQNGYQAFGIKSDGTMLDLITAKTNKPTLTTVMCWYGNRVWTLKNDQLAYSTAYPADYGEAFTATAYRVPVGEERALIPTRDMGIIIGGKNAIWALAPSATPAATDKPEPIVTAYGMVSKKGWVNAGDDIYFFAPDGLRSLKRTVQDKLQVGASYPLSYGLKDEFERISWANISKLSMTYFDNKIFISVPTASTTVDVWVYYPATQSFTVISGWNARCWSTYKISGEERLAYGSSTTGKIFRAWTGYTDEGTTTTNGTAVTSTEEGREEDLGQPLVKKSGGEIEIEAKASGGDYSLTVYARADGGNYSELGTFALKSGTAPILPVALPFTLSDAYVVRQKYPLDTFGVFRTIQYKIVNNDANTETIEYFSVNIVTYQEAYENG